MHGADRLARLLRLRRVQEDMAKRELAAALRDAAEAALAVETARVAVRREAAASMMDAAHPLAGAYAAWLPAGRAEIARAGAEAALRQEAAEAARAALTAARLEAEACGLLVQAQEAFHRQAAEKAAQTTMEDSARARK